MIFSTKGWTIKEVSTGIFVATSLDGLSQLTYRTISSSKITGYVVTSVIEMYKKVGGEFLKLSPWEVKFIAPNIFIP